jgi:AAA+ superfamily predicted ATPase
MVAVAGAAALPIWLYREGPGDYRPVHIAAAIELERARKYHVGPHVAASSTAAASIVEYTIAKHTYKAKLCFTTNVFSQFNTTTRVERPLLLLNATWSYKDDNDAWCAFAPTIAAELEIALRNVAILGPKVRLHFNRHTYDIDVVEMTQRNAASWRVRSLQRECQESVAPATVDSVLQSNATAQRAIDLALASIVGQDDVRASLKKFADTVSFQKLQHQMEAMGGAGTTEPIAAHMVLTGPPGTGKTTVAEAVAKILFAIGRLPSATFVSVTPKDLIGSYVGHTAPKTAAVIERAIGGVLFIDEAYAIADNTHYGPECLAELIVKMTQHRSDLVVIIAGYSDKIHRLFEMNPGLKSRFPEKLRYAMQPFTVEHLAAILKQKARSEGYTIAGGVDVKDFIVKNSSASQRAAENGRLVENLYSAVKEALGVRTMDLVRAGSTLQKEDLRLLTAAEFVL